MDIEEVIKCMKKDIKMIHHLKIDTCKDILRIADEKYYNDETFLNDNEYEYIKEYVLAKEPTYDSEIGHETIQVDKTSVELPIWMGSMNKKYTVDTQKDVVLSDKLDGVSCLYVNNSSGVKLYTRGNGKKGKDISNLETFVNGVKHYKNESFMIRGELIMSKTNFTEMKVTESNARNTVSGIVNSKTPNKKYEKLVDFVAYEVVSEKTPLEQMEYIGKLQLNCVKYTYMSEIKSKEIHEHLILRKQDSMYEIDGIIISKNITYNQIRSGNPKHAFAYKHNFDDNAVVSTVLNVEWNISKNGHFKPTVEFERVVINDVNIHRATGFNGKFIHENKIGVGSIIKVQRSGDVIPYITDIIKSTSPSMPSEYIWSKSGNDITVKSKINNSILEKKLFENMLSTLKFDGLGKKTIHKLFDNKINTLNKLYQLSVPDILLIDGFKEVSATKLHKSIHNRKDNIMCIEYMVASKSFDEGIGTKILENIVKEYQDNDVTLKELLSIEGIGEQRAKSYITGLKRFKEFKENNGIECNIDIGVKTSTQLDNNYIVFTGKRDKELEKEIEAMGGVIQSSVNKKTTHLIYNDINKASKKIKDAQRIPNIEIIQFDTFYKSVYT